MKEIKMRKKILTLMCVGLMAISLVGCNKDKEKDKDKDVTEMSLIDFQITEENEEPPVDEPTAEEVTTGEATTEEIIANDDWSLVGSDRTGYAELPSDWEEHASEADGGVKYSLQYVSPAEDGLVSLVDNDYEFDENIYDVEDPSDIVIQAYVEQYGTMGAVNEGVDLVVMDGVTFYRTIDSLPEGTYTDYEYVLYTYVAYYDGRFYTVIIEGNRSIVEEISAKVEKTYSMTGEGAPVSNNTDENITQVSGKTDWETYYANVDGDEYTLPCDFSEFQANGWAIDESCDGEIIDYEDYTYVFIEKGDKEFYIVVANQSSETPIGIEEGVVVGVVYDYNSEGMFGNIEGGISYGTSYETVIEAFGSPDDIYEDEEDDYKQITYFGETMATDWYTKLEITFENGQAIRIEMIHW